MSIEADTYADTEAEFASMFGLLSYSGYCGEDSYADTEAEFASVPAVLLQQDNSPEGSPSVDHSGTAG